MAGNAPSSQPWIAGAAGDVVVRPHSSGGDGQHDRDPHAETDLAGSPVSTARELIVARREIHIVPGGPQDWIVRADGGRELGHYPSLKAAEAVGRKLARRDRGELLVYDASGRLADRSRPLRSWFGRLLGR